MKGFVTIVKREVIDRRTVLAAAGFAALIPVLIPFAPGFASSSAADVRGAMALAMGLGLGWIFAVFLGATMVGGDLIHGRLGFYFSRPIDGGAIWFGKLIANLFLVFATEVIVFLPALLLSGMRSNSQYDPQTWEFVGLAVLVPVLLLLAAHAVGVMWRARSAWVVLDAVLVVALAGLLWSGLAPFAAEAPLAVLVVGVFLKVCLLGALVAAGWAQVSLGRTDIQRGHRVLSTVMWGVLVSAAAVSIGYVAWATAVNPDDLVTVEFVQPAPQGPWIEVAGEAPLRFDFIPRFLINRETGAHLRIGSLRAWSDQVVFSLDGTRAAWLEPIGFGRQQLVFGDLGDDQPITKTTPLNFQHVTWLLLSERGDRVAILEDAIVSVYQLETGNLLSAIRWKDRPPIRSARFIDRGVLRLYSGRSSQTTAAGGSDLIPMEIVEIDITSGSVATTGVMVPDLEGMENDQARRWRSRIAIDSEARQFWQAEQIADRSHATIRDGRTGEVKVDLGFRTGIVDAFWTDDGRLVSAFVEDDHGWVEVWFNDGRPSQRWPVGVAKRLVLGGESMAGEISLAVGQDGSGFEPLGFRGMSLNIESGVVREIQGVRFPQGGFWWRRFWTKSDGSLWFFDNWALVQWDPVSGTTKHLLGKNEEAGH